MKSLVQKDDAVLMNLGKRLVSEYIDVNIQVLHLGNVEREELSYFGGSLHSTINMAMLVGRNGDNWRRIGLCYWWGRKQPVGRRKVSCTFPAQ